MSSSSIILMHGPNLNTLGKRQPEIYGSYTLADVEKMAADSAAEMGMDLVAIQSNSESRLVQEVHQAKGIYGAIIINAGALTHYSWALADALAYFDGPVVEVHITNTYAREAWRHTSVISPYVSGSILGFGVDGYELAIRAAKRLLANAN